MDSTDPQNALSERVVFVEHKSDISYSRDTNSSDLYKMMMMMMMIMMMTDPTLGI